MWIISRIDESDFGCEERMPGEPLMVLVTLQGDDGRIVQFEVPENWLMLQELDEGDEWPEDIEKLSDEDAKSIKQAEWMDAYYDALEELDLR